MDTDIRLFIQGTEVEFSQTPQILYNYKVTDFTNPTVVKNGYSKTISVEGTPNNNILFDHIFRNDRVQGDGFNALKRAPFQLFVNGDVYEKGYAKLNTVKKTGNAISYEITLFGGVGQFLYNLSFFPDGSDRKKTLADLTYSRPDLPEPDLDFNITKDEVYAAWNKLLDTRYTNERYDILNFAVTSEGIPEDFDSEKVLINTYNNNSFSGASAGYGPIYNGSVNSNGYVLGETSREMMSDNTFDLRSYLLRPVIKCRSILDAIEDPSVNGGYEVDYDFHFFNYDNPYYADSWMTLPMLRDLTLETGSDSALTSASITKSNDNHYAINYSAPLGVKASSIELDVKVLLTPTASTTASTLYSTRDVLTNWSGNMGQGYIHHFLSNQVMIIQLLGFDANDNLVTKSDAYCIGDSFKKAGNSNVTGTVTSDYKYKGGVFKLVPGHFKKVSNKWTYVDENDNDITIHFSVKANNAVRYEVYAEPRTSAAYYYNNKETQYHLVAPSASTSPSNFYTAKSRQYSGQLTQAQITQLDEVRARYGLELQSFTLNATGEKNTFSNTRIPKAKLLATSYTPAEWLLSYCKLFGLYIYQDPAEISSEPDKYPNGVVHICDRDTFYDEKVINLEDYIDRGKEITVTPAVANTKFYSFDLEGIESDADERYRTTYGYSYGRQLVDTTMDFDSETTELYDTNVFKSGIMVQERNKYFTYPVSGVPAYAYDGLKMTFFKPSADGYDTEEKDYPKVVLPCTPINPEGMDYFDSMPKLQVRGEDWSSQDGSGVLLFFDGYKTLQTDGGRPVRYWLTDDLQDMADLNDGNPCWIMTQTQTDTNNKEIAIMYTQLPYFTRDIVRGGNIIHSWNFGHPRETYIPDVYTTDGDSIYDKCWREYINDMYNVNSRVLTCSTRLIGKANPEWMRHYYAFDNAIWRMNAISDWNVATKEVTKTEFLKVLDIDDYKLDRITSRGRVYIVFDQSEIGYTGGVITGRVIAQNPTNAWTFADYFGATDELGNTVTFSTDDYVSPLTGMGAEVQFRMTVPANTGLTQRTFTLGGEDSSDEHFYGSFIQRADDTPVLSFTDTGYTFDLTGGQAALNFYAKNIQSNTLSVSSSSEWAMASVGNGSVTVVVHNYTGTTNRTATITLTGRTNTNTTLTTTATITQTSASLTISTNNLVFDYWDTTGKTVTITTSGPWTAEENEE